MGFVVSARSVWIISCNRGGVMQFLWIRKVGDRQRSWSRVRLAKALVWRSHSNINQRRSDSLDICSRADKAEARAGLQVRSGCRLNHFTEAHANKGGAELRHVARVPISAPKWARLAQHSRAMVLRIWNAATRLARRCRPAALCAQAWTME